jgi:large subunit ribosomal protein L9
VKLLLREDVEGVGHKGDLVEVADGYARNYLVPRGLALKATKGAEAQAEAMRRNRQLKDTADREQAQEAASRLVPVPVSIAARAGEGGKLFGSVTPADIAAAVAEQSGIELDRRTISVAEPIRSLGSHSVQVRLHAEVEFPLTVEVTEQA